MRRGSARYRRSLPAARPMSDSSCARKCAPSLLNFDCLRVTSSYQIIARGGISFAAASQENRKVYMYLGISLDEITLLHLSSWFGCLERPP